MADLQDLRILVRGGGEMASGVIHRLARSGFSVCVTEIAQPLAVRREVSFCEAVYDGEKTVEGLTARRAEEEREIFAAWKEGKVPVIVDPGAALREVLRPQVLVDAILAKRNAGTRRTDAPLVIALGPGFYAGRDVHVVIETNRGHGLGRIIAEGEAEENTGVPGEIGGYAQERVLRSPRPGTFRGKKKIGDRVQAGEAVAEVAGAAVEARISGVLRGILRDGVETEEGMKAGDIDPRGKREHCFTISDKARTISGGVLEAILMKFNK